MRPTSLRIATVSFIMCWRSRGRRSSTGRASFATRASRGWRNCLAMAACRIIACSSWGVGRCGGAKGGVAGGAAGIPGPCLPAGALGMAQGAGAGGLLPKPLAACRTKAATAFRGFRCCLMRSNSWSTRRLPRAVMFCHRGSARCAAGACWTARSMAPRTKLATASTGFICSLMSSSCRAAAPLKSSPSLSQAGAAAAGAFSRATR
mmetsp:Transcript_92297/g.287321  ORF Transcript_92297/g.287321 Transcript_92297/m.287321 type:complete len:206 (+) Transcript_92297:672-1289(+)